MTAVDVAWAIGIAIPVAIFAVLVAMAVRRFLSEERPATGRHRLDEPLGVDREAEEERIRRAARAWQAFAESHVVGPCRECGTPDGECIPQVQWCCNRCAASRGHTHPIVDKRGGDQ